VATGTESAVTIGEVSFRGESATDMIDIRSHLAREILGCIGRDHIFQRLISVGFGYHIEE